MKNERVAQFILAAMMVLLAAGLMGQALSNGRNLWATTIVATLMVVGATVLAQDRPQR